MASTFSMHNLISRLVSNGINQEIHLSPLQLWFHTRYYLPSQREGNRYYNDFRVHVEENKPTSPYNNATAFLTVFLTGRVCRGVKARGQ